MAKNVDHIQHVKSSVVIEENGVFSPKLPNPSALADGEIAVNYAEGYETLSIKNSTGDIVTFSSDNKFYTKDFIDEKLGSGFTGENSANTVTKVIEDNELTTSSALNDLNQRKLDASAYTPTDLSNYYTKSETSGASQIATALNAKTDTATTSALNDVVTAHTANTTIHVTSSDKSAWDAKVDASDLNVYADSVKYNSTSHAIEFYHGTTGGTKVFEVDASAFIIDGMVENVEIDDVTSGSSTVKCLIVSFNTDAGKQDINIPISDIFDPDIYYTKEEIDDAELTISSALNNLNERKLDASAYTPTDLSNYYTKSETSGASQIATALSGKADASDFNTHTADTSIHLTSGDIQTQIDDSISGKVNVSDVVSAITSLNSGSTDPVSTIAIMTVVADNEEVVSSALNDLNERKLDATAYTPTDLSNYYTKSETSGATQVSTALADKVNISDVVSAITPSNSGSTTNPVSVKVVAENEMVMTSALNDLNERKLDVTAYTPTEGETIYYLTSMTGAAGATNLSASWSGDSSGITELYTGLCVRFLIPTAGHASGVTLSINGGEKHKVLYNNTTLTTQYSVSTILNLTYDADTSGSYYSGSSTQATVQGVWRANAEYYKDTNTDTIGYSIGHNQVVYKTDAIAYRYRILLSKDETTLTPVSTSSNVTASTKTLTSESFNPFGDIIYKSSTATTQPNASIPSGVTWTQYPLNLSYSFNISTLVPQKSVYIVAVPQSDGKAKLYDTTGTTTITQTLPTTEDGLIYIYLGQAYSTTNIFLLNNHPIYQYKDGQIRLYTNSSASIIVDQTIDSGTSASTNAVATQAVYNTIKDTELVWTNAYSALSAAVSSHTENTNIHLTANEKSGLHTHTNKNELDSITGSVGTMAYQNASSYSSATQVNTALAGKSNTSHTHASSAITSMTSYSKPSTTSAISTSDTLNQAIGKLECALGGVTLKTITQADYDALTTKDSNTLYIITT